MLDRAEFLGDLLNAYATEQYTYKEFAWRVLKRTRGEDQEFEPDADAPPGWEEI
jgi:hypothetical protein